MITADSVRPGSSWCKGKEWMTHSLAKAKEDKIIKHVEDIKLSNENKKKFREGVVFDTFDDQNADIFAVVNVGKVDVDKVAQREVCANYLYPPLKRKFTSVVRIHALVILACKKFKKGLLIKQLERKETTEEDMKVLDYRPPKFSVFTSILDNQVVLTEKTT